MMITYGQYNKSLPQKLFMLALEVLVIAVSYMILFKGWGDTVLKWLHVYNTGGNHLRHAMMFTFNVLIFLSYAATILIFVQRKITWAEAMNIAFAFALYYIGFPLLGYNVELWPDWIDWVGAALVILGVSLHLVAEWQRYVFKKNPENKGKLLTTGLWSLSRHVNYFADLLWVTGYAMVTRNWWSALIVAFVFVFFYFFNIPVQERYLAGKYGGQFEDYSRRVKSFIPFVL